MKRLISYWSPINRVDDKVLGVCDKCPLRWKCYTEKDSLDLWLQDEKLFFAASRYSVISWKVK